MKVAIYTSIFGGYDRLKLQPRFPNVEYLCFTNEKIEQAGWSVIPVKTPEESPRISAKRPKTSPHWFLDPVFDYSIWIDGSITIVSPDFVSRCLSSINKWGIACMAHPVGNCIFQEASGCAHMEKYRTQKVVEQAEHYRKLGYPSNNGLAACGIIARDMRNPKLRQIGDDWMYENLVWTYQDQISFPFVLWKNQHWFDKISFSYIDRSIFRLTDHTRED